MARVALLAAGVIVTAAAGSALAWSFGLHRGPGADALNLRAEDFGVLRSEALSLFPRGTPVSDAAEGLTRLGFRCTPARHILANINAPSVLCESAGRGFPAASRRQITVMARNGTLSDIAVGNGFDPVEANASTPFPVREGQPAAE